jgi:hypothetical protein
MLHALHAVEGLFQVFNNVNLTGFLPAERAVVLNLSPFASVPQDFYFFGVFDTSVKIGIRNKQTSRFNLNFLTARIRRHVVVWKR